MTDQRPRTPTTNGPVTPSTPHRHVAVTSARYTARMTNDQITIMDERESAIDVGLDGMVREQMLPLRTLLRRQPEARLALAVLEDAAETLRTTHSLETPRARRLASHTWWWVESDDASYPFAFRVICQHLELDAEWLRRGLARWRPQMSENQIHGAALGRKRRRAA